jgi:hypothetical protein
MNHDFRKIAAQKYIGIAVHGTGRWCVLSCDKKACWLCPTEHNAQGAALGSCYMSAGRCQCSHVVLDLMPRSCPLPAKERADDHEDKAWLKRQSRCD